MQRTQTASPVLPILSALVATSIAIGFAPASARANLLSPLPPTAEGFTIQNTHLLNDPALTGTTILRSNAPNELWPELLSNQVTDVLIFKLQTGTEVDEEIQALTGAGLEASRITHIPFVWKFLPAFQVSCEQSVQGLKTMLAALRGPAGTKLLLHCTVGEDRTGVLAGMFRMINEGWSLERAWKDELCERGYEKGNPYKPKYVIDYIKAGLTPFYLKMAYLIEKGKLTASSLDASVCQQDPALEKEFLESTYSHPELYECETSSHFPGFKN